MAEQSRGINRRLGIVITDALRDRFWERVDTREPDECWTWLAAMRNGYGAIKHQGRVHSAHRMAYVLTNGEPASELVIGHKCDNRACCNPNHLEAITPGQNNQDARDRRSFYLVRGEQSLNAVLTEQDVHRIVDIRTTEGLGHTRISRRLGLSLDAVKGVIQGKTWKHITNGPVPSQKTATT